MRPTVARQSGMPHGKTYSFWWGERTDPTARQRGITQYTISPWQTKAAPHWVKSYIFNGFRRISGELFFFGVPMAIGYGVYTWGGARYEYLNSKAGHLAEGGGHE